MNKKSSIAVVLAASVCVSMCGCSRDKQKILELADDYSKGVTGLDAGDIAGCMEDEDDAEEALDLIKEKYEADPRYEEIYDAIMDTMSYEVDTKSVKDESVKVTFTLVDYEAVYEDVYDDGGSFDDYLEALKADDGGNTMEITQTIEFVKYHDEWLIKEDDFENLLEVYAFIDDIPGYGWCNFDVLTIDEFEDILTDVLEIDSSEIAEYEYTWGDMAEKNMGDVYLSINEFNDTQDDQSAQNTFEGLYEMLAESGYPEDSGLYTYYYDGNEGYILYNGDFYMEEYELYYYGGIYVKDNVVVIAVTNTPYGFDESFYNYKIVNSFLEASGLPKPF